MKIKNPFKKASVVIYSDDANISLTIDMGGKRVKPDIVYKLALSTPDTFAYVKFHWCSAEEVALAKLKGEEVVT